MELKDKHALVIGTKRSGMAAIELLLKHGAKVRAMDAEPPAPDEQARLKRLSVPVVEQEPANLPEQGRVPDLIVLSPAVPIDLPLLDAARTAGASVIGEVELASYFLKGPVCGITGSNGKTTTTALTGHLLSTCGIPCQVGGNIGTALTSLVESSRDGQWNVIELSSFQLETIARFRASIGACLNVTPDHLDRHHTFENYAAAKKRLFETQQSSDCAVLNYDDPVCRSFAENAKARIYWFSLTQRVPAGCRLQDDEIYFSDEPFLPLSKIKLRGRHNVENVMAAALMAHLAGAKLADIARAVETFPGVEHRIEFVREVDGVQYFNDSKATNVDAALKAIDAFPQRLWIILGGKDKGTDYAPLRSALERRAKAVLLIGAEEGYPYAAAPLIRTALAGAVPLVGCGTLKRAVRYAREHAQSGDTVLLSPACASFDQFQNYEERGKTFKHLVTELL